MSDLSMYELEDIIWDEFDQDDHIVPHPSDENVGEHSFKGDSCKKPRHEVTGVSSNAGDLYAANSVVREKEERDSTTLNKKRNMPEKEPWSHKTGGVFHGSCDGDHVKEATTLASDDTRMSSSCLTSRDIAAMDNGTITDRSTADNSGSYDYSLGHISQKDDLSFFDNDCEDKESSDLLYYNWADIGNFEDVDRMFRSCDSSFVLGETGNEDELGWFSSEGPIDDSVEVLKSDFKFPSPQSNALTSMSEDCVPPPKLNNKKSHFISETKDKFEPIMQGVDSDGRLRLRNATSEYPQKDDRMVDSHKKQSKHQNQTEGKRKSQCAENGCSFYNVQNDDAVLCSMDTTHHVFTSISNQQGRQNIEPDSFTYLQTGVHYLHPDYNHAPDQAMITETNSGIKVESKGLTSLSPMESSYGSNQLQPMESSGDPSFEGTAVKLDEKREKGRQSHGFQPLFTGHPRNVGMISQPSMCDPFPLPLEKHVHQSANETDSQSDVEGVQVGCFREIGSLNAQESTSMNSGLDEISLEATSFCQLQLVMEQLDLRTKLCIRDSLYRLARSAEQRHNHANLGGGCPNYRNADGAFISEGTNKCTGFMDIETDTNPIDRSIAHLLFHRPSETHGMSAQNLLPHKSNTMIDASVSSPLMMAEKLDRQEEDAAESDD